MAEEIMNNTVTEQAAEAANPEEKAEQAEAKTFTQADVDRIVAQRLARAEKDQAEKIKAARSEGFSEAEKLAKMTEEQRVQHAREQAEQAAKEREDSLTAREHELEARLLKAQAVETLQEKKVPVKLADVLDYTSADTVNKSIELIEKTFREAVQEGVEARLSRSGGNLRRAPGEAGDLLSQMRKAAGVKEK
ncbi:MAG: DUF4355 domain-containing protein [Clostridiales bacterium]|nr:DUF4355 domain-containing protein [Clostridiales bacterium]